MKKICKTCGKEYEAKTKRSVFCSSNCKTKFYNETHSEKKNCLECKKEFISKQNSKFCSTSCGSKYTHKNIKKVLKCSICGKEFEFTGTTNKKYCDVCRKKVNINCTNKYKLSNNLIKEENIGIGSGGWVKKGAENHTFKNGIGIYRRIKYDNLKFKACEECGSKENLTVHHKDENRKNNDLSNLICLCRACHTKIHNFQRDIFGKFTK